MTLWLHPITRQLLINLSAMQRTCGMRYVLFHAPSVFFVGTLSPHAPSYPSLNIDYCTLDTARVTSACATRLGSSVKVRNPVKENIRVPSRRADYTKHIMSSPCRFSSLMQARERILEELFILTRGNDQDAASTVDSDDFNERLQQFAENYKEVDQQRLAVYLDKHRLM